MTWYVLSNKYSFNITVKMPNCMSFSYFHPINKAGDILIKVKPSPCKCDISLNSTNESNRNPKCISYLYALRKQAPVLAIKK